MFNTSRMLSCVGKSKRYAFLAMHSNIVYGSYLNGCSLRWYPLKNCLSNRIHTWSPDWKVKLVQCLSWHCLEWSWDTFKEYSTWVWSYDKLWIKRCVLYYFFCWCVEPKFSRVRGIFEGTRGYNPRQTLNGENHVEECMVGLYFCCMIWRYESHYFFSKNHYEGSVPRYDLPLFFVHQSRVEM